MSIQDRILDNLLIRLPGSLAGVVQLELFNVMGVFLDRSGVWREDVTFGVKAGVSSYDLSPSAGVIARLEGVMNANGLPVPAVMPVPGTVDLFTTPTQADTLTASVFLTADPDGVSKSGIPDVPDWIYVKYQQGIQDGVLAYMMSQPAKPYSNLNLARVHLARFNSVIAQASSDAQHGNLFRGQAWRFPQGWATRKRR